MTLAIHPCILSGGAGTRLWPRSRRFAPKQFQALLPGASMIRQTALRFAGRDRFAPAAVICNGDHAPAVAEAFADGPPLSAVLCEPLRRDTAAAAALAAHHVADVGGPDAFALLLPSDHHFSDPESFAAAVSRAASEAGDRIATFGVVPDEPHTGYGYIRAGQGAGAEAGAGALRPVEVFAEKPDLPAAERYLKEGGWYWNAGIFLFRPQAFLAELERHAPAVAGPVARAWAARTVRERLGAADEMRFGAAFAEAEAVSLDYALMEKTQHAAVMPVSAGWSDVGDWDALAALRPADADGNAVSGDAVLLESRNTLVEAGAPGRLVVASGVEDLVIVDTADALLVTRRNAAQSVKAVHAALASAGRPEADYHRDAQSRRAALRKAFRDWVEAALPGRGDDAEALWPEAVRARVSGWEYAGARTVAEAEARAWAAEGEEGGGAPAPCAASSLDRIEALLAGAEGGDALRQAVQGFAAEFCRGGLVWPEPLREGAMPVEALLQPAQAYRWAKLARAAARYGLPAEAVPPLAPALAWADSCGHSDEDALPLVREHVRPDGAGGAMPERFPLSAQLDKLRHHLAHGTPRQLSGALDTAESVWRLFLAPAPPGSWHPALGPGGAPVADAAPAPRELHALAEVAALL